MKISWQAFQQEALDCLRALVRLDTTNPPGNERIAADYMAEALGAHGVEFVIRESAPTRANMVARHKGTDSSAGALLLSSHTDVVPVERSGWTREPFSGEIADGCLWGRGSIDMKSKCAMDLVMMTAMKRAGVKPNRDVILAAVADEEAGSDFGAKFLVERHPELVRAGYVLNEVGGFTVHLRNKRFYPIQVAEKGFVTIKMKVTAMPGHGSMPRSDTAISRMSELITQDRADADAQECFAVHASDARGDGRAGRIAGAAVRADALEHGVADDSARRIQGQRDSRRGDDRARRAHAAGRRSRKLHGRAAADSRSRADLRAAQDRTAGRDESRHAAVRVDQENRRGGRSRLARDSLDDPRRDRQQVLLEARAPRVTDSRR